MFVSWLACDYSPFCSHADRGAVARFWTSWRLSVNLRQLRKINISSESIFDSGQIGVVPICCELNAISQAFFQIVDEMIGRVCMAATNKPTGDKLCLRINGNPRPHVAPTLRLCLRARVPLLRSDKSPNLIALKFSAVEISESVVLILRTRAAKIAQKFVDCISGKARH